MEMLMMIIPAIHPIRPQLALLSVTPAVDTAAFAADAAAPAPATMTAPVPAVGGAAAGADDICSIL